MSINDLEKASNLIEENFTEEECFFDGAKDKKLIEQAEKKLKIFFPSTYKLFLERYGFGGINSFDIDGVTEYKFNDSEVGGVVWTNLHKRTNLNFPHHLISIYDVGEGTTYCLDTSQMNEEGECPVVAWPIDGYDSTPVLEIVAPDFGKFFLDMVEQEIAYKKQTS